MRDKDTRFQTVKLSFNPMVVSRATDSLERPKEAFGVGTDENTNRPKKTVHINTLARS
jgi:hypothetical protein